MSKAPFLAASSVCQGGWRIGDNWWCSMCHDGLKSQMVKPEQNQRAHINSNHDKASPDHCDEKKKSCVKMFNPFWWHHSMFLYNAVKHWAMTCGSEFTNEYLCYIDRVWWVCKKIKNKNKNK